MAQSVNGNLRLVKWLPVSSALPAMPSWWLTMSRFTLSRPRWEEAGIGCVVKELVHSHQWPLHPGRPRKASIDVFLPVVFQSRKEPPVATGSSALVVQRGELVESPGTHCSLLLCLSVAASCIAKSSLCQLLHSLPAVFLNLKCGKLLAHIPGIYWALSETHIPFL